MRVRGGVAPIAMWARPDWRTRWRTLIELVLLVSVAGGVVVAAIAGARRTATSLERLAAATNAADAIIDVGGGGIEAAQEITELPVVEHVAVATLIFAVLEGVDTDAALILPRDDGLGVVVERELLVRGRRADPSRPDEVTINESGSRLLGLDAGDPVQIGTLTPEQVAAEDYFPARGPVIDARITGVTRGIGDLASLESAAFVATPALYPTLAGEVDEFTYVALHLRPGATVAQLEDGLAEIAPPGAPIDVFSFEVTTRSARRTISALAVGVGAFAAAAGAVALVIVAQAVGRHVDGAAPDDRSLRAIGMTRRQRALALASTVLPLAVLAPAAAVLVAVAASPLTPIGLARRAEPDPGIRLDLPVLLLGAVAIAAVVALAGIVAGLLATREQRDVAPRRPSTAATAAALAGASPSIVNGVALALDRRHSLAARSTLVAVTVGVVGLAAATTFSASLNRLVDTPGRWGAPWDLSLDFTSESVDEAAGVLAEDETLTSVARWDAGATLVSGAYVRAYGIEPLRGDLGFTLLEGRQPEPGEIVIGPVTADRADLDIGDTVTLARPDGTGNEAEAAVVGVAVFPEIDDGDFDDAVGMTRDDFTALAAISDLFEAAQVVVQIGDDTSVPATIARLQEDFGEALLEPLPVRPGSVRNLAGVQSIPRALLVFFALLSVASLAHAVRSTVVRGRAHFATLRAVGMTRRQRWYCSLTQSLTFAAVAAVIGVPLGLAAGRATWTAVAHATPVAGDPLVPTAAIALMIAGAMAAAVAVAAAARWATPQPEVAFAMRAAVVRR